MDKKFVVLVVEDNLVAQEMAKALLSPHAEVLSAICLRDAMLYIKRRDDINIIILDWYVPMFRNETLRGGDTTQDLVYRIEHGLENVRMYSASAEEENNRQLESLGCIYADKQTAPKMALEYILEQQK